MANAVVTLKIMPESPDTDLKEIEDKAALAIKEFGGELGKVDIQPVAFGLKSLSLIFVMDENLGSTEKLENNIKEIAGVNSVEVTDVRRAIG
jgi:translation elongation factor aEF-1 beta